LRKLKILAVTLAMTLAFASPAFASVLGETEVEAGNLTLTIGFSD